MTEPTFGNLASPEMLWGNKVESLQDVDFHKNPRLLAIDILRIFLAAKQPIILYGPPGSAKSSIIRSLTRQKDELGNNYNVVVIIPSTTDPTVLNGVMYTTKNDQGETVMKRSLPDTAVEIRRMWDEERRLTVLMLDEISTALISQQHSLLNFLTTGEWGDLNIADIIAIVMAANPKGTVNVSRELDMQFLNRAGHIPWVSQKDIFLEGYRSGFGDPQNKPPINVVREIEGMMNLAPDEVFRSTNKKWTLDSLVPYHDLELSERTADMYGEVSALLDKTMGAGHSHNPDVKWRYKKLVGEALFGKEWSGRLATVLREEAKKSMDAPTVLSLIDDSMLDMSYDDMVNNLQKAIFSSPMNTGELSTLFGDLVSNLNDKNDSGVATAQDYCAVWAFASLCPDVNQYGLFTSDLAKALIVGKELTTKEVIQQNQAIPHFVPDTLKNMVRDILSS